MTYKVFSTNGGRLSSIDGTRTGGAQLGQAQANLGEAKRDI